MFVFSAAGSWLASLAAMCACQACTCVTKEVMRRSARLAYCVLFFFAIILAWILRDFAKPLIEKLPWIAHQAGTSDAWYGQQAVYRVSMGNFMFFGVLSLVLIGVKYKSDKRDMYLQHGGWLVKLGLWILCVVIPFFLPVGLVNAYSWLARIGSGAFLIVQMIILLDCTQTINDTWVAKEDTRWLYALLGVTVACYLGTIGLSGVMFYWFKPAAAGACSFNVGMIVLAIFLCIGFTGLSLQRGSIFPAACISLYSMYLCYSALQSEPHDFPCNGLGKKLSVASGGTIALGMIVTLASVVYSALRAGSNTSTFSLTAPAADDAGLPLVDHDEEEGTSAGLDGLPDSRRKPAETRESSINEFEPVTYNYSFFHLIFALASMYIAMLMTGWGTGAEEKDMIDVGWTSVWVKLVSMWTTVGLYSWTLVAPMIFPDREFL